MLEDVGPGPIGVGTLAIGLGYGLDLIEPATSQSVALEQTWPILVLMGAYLIAVSR